MWSNLNIALRLDDNHHYGNGAVEATIPITSTSIERVYCFAPVWNSFEWVNKSRQITVKG